jgi:hypothetical protein
MARSELHLADEVDGGMDLRHFQSAPPRQYGLEGYHGPFAGCMKIGQDMGPSVRSTLARLWAFVSLS